MKKYLSALFLLFFSLSLFSQNPRFTVGISAGMSFSGISTAQDLGATYSWNKGVAGMLVLRKDLTEHLSLETQLGYLQNGYIMNAESYINTSSYSAETSYLGFTQYTNNSYLRNAWILSYRQGDRLRFAIGAGPWYACYLGTVLTVFSYGFVDPREYDAIGEPGLPVGYFENTETEKVTLPYTALDWGFCGQASLGFTVSPDCVLRFTFSWLQGLRNVSTLELESLELTEYSHSLLSLISLEFGI